MEQIQLWNKNIKSRNSLQGQTNIGSLANSHELSEEDIKILTFANISIPEPIRDEVSFDRNVFKKASIYETLG